MKFLQAVAQDLRKKITGHDLSSLTLVLPGKRASLFMNQYLLQNEQELLWSPQYLTISEFFEQLSPWQKADEEETIFSLYGLYRDITHTKETIDHFYGWGERMLADFDDIDKNLADADKVFSSTSDWNELRTNIQDLSPADQSAIHDFFEKFFTRRQHCKSDGIQQKFFDLWQHLPTIYHRLNTLLAAQGKAYEGALYRHTLQLLQEGEITLPKDRKYAFIGFNVLDEVEKSLFQTLQMKECAWFYWDYDAFYATDEAATFIQRNLQLFPNELTETSLFQQDWSQKRIEIVESPGENAAIYSLSKWIDLSLPNEDLRETAVVLCDENMLEPVLYAIPNEVDKVNITKGYPLAHTAPYELVNDFFEKSKVEGEHTFSAWTPLLNKLDKVVTQEAHLLHQVFKETAEEESAAPIPVTPHQRILNDEAYFATHTLITQLTRSFQRLAQQAHTRNICFNLATLRRLTLQVLKRKTIPLKGEPVVGLQVMGLLETRNLDFKRVILLSAGEGKLPKVEHDLSYIPFLVRKAHHLTLPSRKTAVYAYYFYRLLQRAEQITICYNGSIYENQVGEPSRFILRLINRPELKEQLHFTQLTEKLVPKQLEPLGAISTKEPYKLAPRYSASSLNTFINCPLQFYLEKVNHYNSNEVVEDFDNRLFGTFFHAVAEGVYLDLKAKSCFTSAQLKAHAHSDYIRSFFEKAYAETKASNMGVPVHKNKMVEESVVAFMKNVLNYDAEVADQQDWAVEGTELKLYFPLCLPDGTQVELGGIIDRLDVLSSNFRVFDYKTGKEKTGKEKDPKGMKELFDLAHEEQKHADYAFQMWLYCCAVAYHYPQNQVTAALFHLPNYQKGYDPMLKMDKVPVVIEKDKDAYQEFTKGLQELLLQMRTNLFLADRQMKKCEYCTFSEFCRPQKVKE